MSVSQPSQLAAGTTQGAPPAADGSALVCAHASTGASVCRCEYAETITERQKTDGRQ